MIAYYISNFPKLSEKFILREISLIRSKNRNIKIFASFGPEKKIIDQLDNEELKLKNSTEYITRLTAIFYLIAYLHISIKYFKKAYKLSNEATNKVNPFILLGRAIYLSKKCSNLNISHIHAHWPYATMAVYLSNLISSINYSISIHAHEMFHEFGHFNRCLPNVKFISFCNNAAMQVVIKRYPNLTNKCHLIYHGIDTNFFNYIKPKNNIGKTIRLITGGRLTKTKGIHRLINSSSYCIKMGFNIKLIIFGEGPEKKNLEKLVSDLHIKNNVRILGWISSKEVRNHVADSDLFCLLADTNYHDGIPNVFVESMSIGRPVISSKLPAISELIYHNENGFIIDSKDDENEFLEIIEYLYKMNNFKKISLNARKIVKENYDSSVLIDNLIDLLYD